MIQLYSKKILVITLFFDALHSKLIFDSSIVSSVIPKPNESICENNSDITLPFLCAARIFRWTFYETEACQIGTSKGDLQFDDRATLRTKIIGVVDAGSHTR